MRCCKRRCSMVCRLILSHCWRIAGALPEWAFACVTFGSSRKACQARCLVACRQPTPRAAKCRAPGLQAWYQACDRDCTQLCHRACPSRPTLCVGLSGTYAELSGCTRCKKGRISAAFWIYMVLYGSKNGGQGGIRTHGELPPTAVFKTAALNHSATCP